MTGVYILMFERKVIYVGATENWPMRLTQHKEIKFSEARLFECEKKNLLEYEKRFINFFKPINNFSRKVKRKITDEWILQNHTLIKEYIESNNDERLAIKARAELSLSPKYTTTDLTSSIVRIYCRVMKSDYSHKKCKFKSLEVIPA